MEPIGTQGQLLQTHSSKFSRKSTQPPSLSEVGTRKCFKDVPTCCPSLLLPKNNSLIFNSARQAGTDLNPFPFSCKDLIKNYETMKVRQVGKRSHLNAHSVICYQTTLLPKFTFNNQISTYQVFRSESPDFPLAS